VEIAILFTLLSWHCSYNIYTIFTTV